MNSQELRIGNCLYDPEENENILIEGVDIFLIQMGHCRESKYEPITLTEQRLIDLGFVKYKATSYIINEKYIVEFLFDNPSFRILENEECSGFLCNIKYVHQLQNLYFSLAQQELNIEL